MTTATIGETIAGYRLDRLIGRGGMGVVYEARQLSLDRRVALKLLAPHLSEDPAFRERFRREGTFQAALEHPHIATVYEFGETDNLLFLAMKYVDGPNLKELAARRTVEPSRALAILRQIADALDAAHARGIVHRDIKPQNILVGDDDYAYLVDFGLTRADGESRLTMTGHFVGSIDYLAPELIQGGKPTTASDIYAFAGVLYECLSGDVPYPRESEGAMLFAHMTDEPPRLSVTRKDLPAGLDEVIARGLAKAPADRPPAASALIAEAYRALADAPQARSGQTAVDGIVPPSATAPVSRPPALEEKRIADTPERPRGGTVYDPVAAVAPIERAPEQKRRRFLRPLIAGVAALALAAPAAVLGRATGTHTAQAAPHTRFASTWVSVQAPGGWRESAAPPAVPGLTFASALSVLSPTARGGLVAGVLGAPSPPYIPAALAQHAKRDTVRLGNLEAVRYSGLHPKGFAAALTLYVAPTRRGSVAFGCYGAPHLLRVCEDIVARARLRGVDPLQLGPSRAYARALEAALRKLKAAATATQKLESANRPQPQHDAAAALQREFKKTKDAVASMRVRPSERVATARIVAGLAAVAADYGKLAAAAQVSDQSAWSTARAAATHDEKHLTHVVRALKALGYRIQK